MDLSHCISVVIHNIIFIRNTVITATSYVCRPILLHTFPKIQANTASS